MDPEPPELHLLSGDCLFDVGTIAAFFEALTGRTLTEEDIAEMRAYLDAHKL